jgi:SAM-dependent methyltransferase
MSASTPIDNLSPADIRGAVAERYGQVAAQPGESFNFPVGRAFAEAIGYPAELLATLPAPAVAAFAGVTYAHDYAALQPGETVLDLGCGAGMDAIVAARAVGPAGRVLAVDYSAPMVALARDNARAAGVTNLRVERAAIEELPFAAESVDVVQANGVFNLSPEKRRAVAEVWRVLRPGGRLIAAEIALAQALDDSERATLDDWFR